VPEDETFIRLLRLRLYENVRIEPLIVPEPLYPIPCIVCWGIVNLLPVTTAVTVVAGSPPKLENNITVGS